MSIANEENLMDWFSYYWNLHIQTISKMQDDLVNGSGDELSMLIKQDEILLRKCHECINQIKRNES